MIRYHQSRPFCGEMVGAFIKSSVCNNTLDVFSYTEYKVYEFDLTTLISKLLIYII